MVKIELDQDEFTTVQWIIEAWINEGFTSPPYADVVYNIFEKFKIDEVEDPHRQYDIERPGRK